MDAGRGNDNIEVDNNNAGNPWNPLHESTYNLGPGDDTLDFGTSPTGTAYVIGGSGKDDV
jgi:phenylalanyl-tRNA synthetase beta subunit